MHSCCAEQLSQHLRGMLVTKTCGVFAPRWWGIPPTEMAWPWFLHEHQVDFFRQEAVANVPLSTTGPLSRQEWLWSNVGCSKNGVRSGWPLTLFNWEVKTDFFFSLFFPTNSHLEYVLSSHLWSHFRKEINIFQMAIRTYH
jgi:hypothetical protein